MTLVRTGTGQWIMNLKQIFSSQAAVFLKRQEPDWKITVIRTSLDRFAYQIVFPYLSIYIIALGATATQLGLANSLGMITAAIFAPLVGWFIDRTGPKKIYLVAIGLLSVSYLSYGLAQSWSVVIVAMITYWLGFSMGIHSCATVCGNCLTNDDRATGMTICETVAAGLLGMAGPMLGAWLVTIFGGVNANGIRPLFYFSLAVTVSTFLIIATQLSDKSWPGKAGPRPNLIRDLHQVLREGRHLKRWLLIASASQLPVSMVFAFSQVYAHEMKGANQFILGAMVTGSALASITFAVPLGRLADRVGRKRVLYFTLPLFWVSTLLLVCSRGQTLLVIAGILQGFFYISQPISAAIERELVPREQMGRWIGIARCFRMTVNASMALIAGVIWDRIGPEYVFLTFIAIDLLVRMPLLISMPETLGHRFDTTVPEPTHV
jgi:MFS family permease